MPSDLISREALLAEYDRVHVGEPGNARKLIAEAPAVDAVEVVRYGEWIAKEVVPKGHYHFNNMLVVPVCSMCNSQPANMVLSLFCPNCGAKMDGGDCAYFVNS